jgi:hypothetical protein
MAPRNKQARRHRENWKTGKSDKKKKKKPTQNEKILRRKKKKSKYRGFLGKVILGTGTGHEKGHILGQHEERRNKQKFVEGTDDPQCPNNNLVPPEKLFVCAESSASADENKSFSFQNTTQHCCYL